MLISYKFTEAAATEILDNAIAVGEASGDADKKDEDLNFDEQKKEDATTQSSNESSNEDTATETEGKVERKNSGSSRKDQDSLESQDYYRWRKTLCCWRHD